MYAALPPNRETSFAIRIRDNQVTKDSFTDTPSSPSTIIGGTNHL